MKEDRLTATLSLRKTRCASHKTMSRIIINVNYAEKSRLTKTGLYKGNLHYIWFVKLITKTNSIANVILVG